MKTAKPKTKNPVAKHAGTFNKAQVHTDKKKELKRGYTRHKTDLKNEKEES
ncbi:MAG: hypothetical protein HOL48_01960 [Porticoccaceae bacterium]|jgi:hypothetical protein|nr:hypothetical protein [Porticoccaceae bacterium]